MGYVTKALAGDEKIIYKAKFNWTYDVAPTLWFALGASPLLLEIASIVGGQGSLFAQNYSYRVFLVSGLFLGSSLWLAKMIRKWTTQIVVTTGRFIYKTGLAAREIHEVDLGHIEEVTLKQSLPGRLFGYGDIKIRGTGIGVIELPPLDRPLVVQRMIEEGQQGVRGQAAPKAA